MSRPREAAPGAEPKRMRYGGDVDPHAPPMSKVVHARAVPEGLLTTEMSEALGQFGPINHIVMMPQIRQALVEFTAVESAAACVQQTKEQGIIIRDRPVFFNFSKSQEINKGVGPASGGIPNKILLMTIQNALFPITCDIIHTICSNVGAPPNKCVMVRKRGVQALVQFDSVSTATTVRDKLNLQDIYKGCCTLKIEFSHTESLNVHYNSDDTKDYTNPALPTRSTVVAPVPGPAPGFAHGYVGPRTPAPQQFAPYMATGYGGPHPPYGYNPAASPTGQSPGQPHFGHVYGGGLPGAPPAVAPGVMVFYELDTARFNCQRLFNLVCLYANPTKIKFIVTKPGMAMVQVHDQQAAAMTLSNLKGLQIFGKTLDCGLSKHATITDSHHKHVLPDGSDSEVDFTTSRNFRFRPGPQNNKQRLCGPTNVLHFFNAPKDTAHTTYFEILKRCAAPQPLQTVTFPDDGNGPKSDRGLMEFATVEDAAVVLVLCNHVEMTTSDNRVFTLKFSFSQGKIASDKPGVTRLMPGNPGVPAGTAAQDEAVSVTVEGDLTEATPQAGNVTVAEATTVS